ncbi:MAG: heavy metal translocating P-type ATPase [Oceanicoccus sp.]
MLQKVQVYRVECFHCGLPVAAGDQFCAELDGEQRHFCCPACRAVATTIVASGLSSYYQYRTVSDFAPDSDTIKETFAAFDDAEFQHRYVTTSPGGENTLATTQLLIGGIHCAACIWLLEKYLGNMPGIEKASVSLSEQKAVISWRVGELALSDVCSAIASLGYLPEPYNDDHVQQLQRRENHLALRRLGIAGIGMMQVGMFAIALYAGALQSIEIEYRDFMRWVSLLVATPVVCYSAQPFFVGAWRGIKMKSPGMDLPVALAIGLAYLASAKATITGMGDVYFDSATMFTFFLLAGRYMELRARHFGGRSSNDLNSLLPATVSRIVDRSRAETVSLFKVSVGDILRIKTGQVIPADGVVIEGYSGVDESQMTGEFSLQTKSAGDSLLAGTLNGTGVLTMEVRATGAGLKLQSINQLLLKAQSQKPAVSLLVDQIARYFVVGVLLITVLTYIFWMSYSAGTYSNQAFWVMLSVLVISCPCALSLATPAALTAATNYLRRRGLLVTAQHVWEVMPKITDVVCDKTGTLTEGRLSISDTVSLGELSSLQCLAIAATLESYSEHPIAGAFSSAIIDSEQGLLPASSIELCHGQGVQGTVDGVHYCLGGSQFSASVFDQVDAQLPAEHAAGQWLLLSCKQRPVCWFRLTDTVREGAGELISNFKQRGLRVHMLSGDSSGAAKLLANQLGIETCVEGANPQEKLDYIHSIQNSGRKVLMLGDGINDVPVLAGADISVAMVNASNLAKTQTDSILLSGDLNGVLVLMDLAIRTGRVIRQNLAWALAYNLLAIPLAAMALIPPYAAAIGMSVSSLVVIVNALRLQTEPRPDGNSRYASAAVMVS